MNAFVVKILPSLLIIVLMTSSVATARRENENGYSGRAHGTKNNTKDDCNPEVGTGIRRNLNIRVYPNPDQQCYRQFFVTKQGQGQGRPPVGLRQPSDPAIRYICQPPNQQLQQQTYYATMFDEDMGIAVFSAYRLTWENAVFPGGQEKDGFCATPGIQRQGSADLYSGQFPYDKGHLAPAKTFSQNPLRYVSTYTYTNAVPQCNSFNNGLWKTAENRIRIYAEHFCTNGHQHGTDGTLYLLTGTSFSRFDPNNFPQANQVQIEGLGPQNQQIWIPVSMWTAGCCVRPNNQQTRSFAVIGNNLQKPIAGQEDTVSLTQRVSVRKLQDFLRNDAIANQFTNGGQNHAPRVRLFPGNLKCLNDVNFDIMKVVAPQY